MSRRIRFAAITAALACMSTTAMACETVESLDRCHAVIADQKLFIAFPASASTEHRWNRVQTPIDHLEYEWQVQLGNCAADRNFRSDGLAFGIQHFKHAGATEATGFTADLVRSSQLSVARRFESPERVRYSILPEHRLVAGERDGRVYIGATDPATVATLVRERPRFAQLVERTPENPDGQRCVTAIEYAEPVERID